MYRVVRNPGISLPAVQNIQSAVNRMFDSALDEFLGSDRTQTTAWTPPVEIYETAGELVFVVELPGLEKEEVSISFENGFLNISGERKQPEAKDRTYHRGERWYGRFERAFQLPVAADGEKIQAKLEKGVLHISIPKREEAKTRQIPVTIG
jgi:HSP20 family protein